MICRTCREEVRFGWRVGTPDWWHQGEVDHQAFPIVPDSRKPPPVIPPVEIPCHPVDPASFAPRSGIRQVINLLAKHGWELRSITHARGPYIGSSGEMLSMSDTIVIRSRGPVRLDDTRRIAVASWRDGAFDFSFIGTIKGGLCRPFSANSSEMKDWIKGIE